MRWPFRLGITAALGMAWGVHAWSLDCPQDCDEADKVGGCCPQATTPARPAQTKPASPAASPTPKPRTTTAKPTATSARIEEMGGIRMAWIPAGNFLMGSTASDAMNDGETPQHQVEISAGFWLMETEVTQGLWQSVMGSNPSATQQEYWDGQSREACSEYRGVSLVDTNYPVMCVTWCEAVLFANALSRREGLTPAYQVPTGFVAGMGAATCEAKDAGVAWDKEANGYRLPTEAEWEYAAREGQKGSRYAGTNEGARVCNYANVPDTTAKATWNWTFTFTFACNDKHAALAPVGSFAASAWGLKDMTGNVLEWVFDTYDMQAYSNSNKLDPVFSGGNSRVLRGGAWNVDSVDAAGRGGRSPGYRASSVGLRLARSAPDR